MLRLGDSSIGPEGIPTNLPEINRKIPGQWEFRQTKIDVRSFVSQDVNLGSERLLEGRDFDTEISFLFAVLLHPPTQLIQINID